MLKYLIFLFILLIFLLPLVKISIKISFIYRYQSPNLLIACLLPFGLKFQVYPRRRHKGSRKKTGHLENLATKSVSGEQFRIMPIIWQTGKRFLSKVTCSKLYWHMAYGTGSADRTAELYGVLSTMQYIFASWLQTQLRLLRETSLSLTPYFNEAHFHMTFSCMLHFRLGEAIAVLFYFLRAVWKQNVKKERNEKYDGASNSSFNENSTRKFG